MVTLKYPFEISVLGEEDGPGYLIRFPYLPGCMSDGATADAGKAWLQARKKGGDSIPAPRNLKKAF